MSRILFIISFFFIQNVSSLKFKETAFDFGKAKEHTVVTHTFIITNPSKVPLIIYSVSTTCGCTTTSYPKLLKPNQSGKIIVKLDTKNNKGYVAKYVVVMANTKEEYHKLSIKGTVE